MGSSSAGDDVEHVFEILFDAETFEHLAGMGAGAVGEDQLAAGKFSDRSAHRRIWLQRRVVNLMDVFEKVVGLEAVLGHHAAHGGAVTAVIVFLNPEGLVLRDIQILRDEIANAHVDLLPQVDVMRIERVVEVEHPCLDMGETALVFLNHGVPNLRVLPAPAPISTRS